MKSYTCNENLETTFNALRTLTDDEKDSVFAIFTDLRELIKVLILDEKEKIEYINEVRRMILSHMKFHNAMCKLLGVELPKDKTIAEEYEKLNPEKRFDAALALMNKPAFQKDCSKILIEDFKRVAKSDPLIGALDKMFNISGCFESAIEHSIGCDHKYIVEK